MQIEAIIFDMDGVLLDSEPLHWLAMNRALGDAARRDPFDRAHGIEQQRTHRR